MTPVRLGVQDAFVGMDGIAAKLWRAEEDLKAFYHAVKSLAQSDPITIDTDPRPEPGYYSVRVDHVPPLGPDFGVRLGEIVHNLRSALDHLVWQVALTQVKRPVWNAAFPITDSARDFRTQCGVLADLTPAQQAKMERFQPYNRSPVLLSQLRLLSNRDKHRVLNPVLVLPTVIDVLFVGENCSVTSTRFVHTGHGLKVGAEFAVLQIPNPPPKPKVRMESYLFPDIGFEDVDAYPDVVSFCVNVGAEIKLICRQFEGELGPPSQGWPPPYFSA